MSQRRRRSLALLTSGVLALPLLTGCGAGDEEGGPVAAGQDIATTAREKVADGGVVRWAVDALPETLNTFQADADATTARIAGAVLPQLFVLDGKGRPVANPDYLEKAEVVEREPKQVVVYKLNQQAVWSDGREIGAADFVAQWRALNGKDSAYWTARNAGYDRVEKIERGKTDLEVKVTFAKPYTDWRSLFTPLYPKQVTGTPDAFNEGARGTLKVTAGPFGLGAIDKKTGTAALTRNPRWWGRPAKLDTLVLTAVPRAERPAALAAGKLDLAEIDRVGADRIALAHRDAAAGKGPGGKGAGGAPAHGPGASMTAAQATLSWAIAYGADESKAKAEQEAREKNAAAAKRYADEQAALRNFTVRKSLEPAYTQLAMNGASGPLADERVRRAVARALDRKALAEIVLKPLGLPAKPVGSHLALAGQPAYADNSDALGGQDTQAAQALLADAGWRRGGKLTEPSGAKAGPESSETDKQDDGKTPAGPGTGNDGLYIVGQDDERNGDDAKPAAAGRPGAFGGHEGVIGMQGMQGMNGLQGMKGMAGRSGVFPMDQPIQEGAPYAPYAQSGPDGEIVDADQFAQGTRPSPVLAPAPLVAQEEASLLAQAAAVEAAAGDDGKRNPARDGDAADPAKAPQAPQASQAPAPAAPGKQPVRTSGSMLAKDGKALTLRFVLPAGPGSESLRTVGERISQMLQKVGVDTELTKVADESFFKDHIASGQYDLALYSWPATAYPATDARPIFAKPEPAADGSLLVEQNYTRVGTDHIDQLFDQALGELDEEQSRELMRKADARIWAAAGSIPLYQRPELVAAKPSLANAGAFGLGTPRFQDIGWKKAPTAKDKGGDEKKK
ncbi:MULTISPECIES: ABC transporter family substrate-binding protein [unclassified Streptomyces]|uniref:ABC transporter family substrate-binding protein n=1 Tax=unclassified Streptomyces TaxID=2593676 RepID=UPI001BE63D89|nr:MULTISPECIES: ABC transporter family substrate-binding protein [unclassified Streptomyces]MBT2403032.1 ABC transporter family substrate-binding protein [Streptomyces sp. ISL-21]MBT2609685.1 ABC transporter family substrate-binding protein [Streptomyces sp. ISL-87]